MKSSKSRILVPLPSGSKLFQILNPNTQGNDSNNSSTRLTEADFFLLHPVKSIPYVTMFSMTAMTVVIAANTMNRKNRLPQRRPLLMALKIFGKVINRRFGPLSGSTPKLKQAGKIIKPARSATTVSRTPIYSALLVREWLLSIRLPNTDYVPIPILNVKKACPIAAKIHSGTPIF